MLPRCIVTILLLIFGNLPGQSGDIQFERFISGELGLKGGYLYKTTEDKEGFIWVAGNFGVQRYDGYKFKSYADLISHPFVRYVYCDEQGHIWIASDHGLNILDPETHEVRVYLSNSADSTSISNNHIEPIFEDSDGKFWIGTANGLNRFDSQSETFTRYYCSSSSTFGSANRIYSIIADNLSEDMLWIGAGSGLYSFNKRTGIFTSIPFPLPGNARWRAVLGVYQHLDGSLLFGVAEQNSIFHYFPKDGSWQFYPLASQQKLTPYRNAGVYNLYYKSDAELWVTAVSMIGTLDLEAGKLKEFALDDTLPGAMLAAAARHLYIDTRGHLWAPSLKGISRSIAPVAEPSRRPDKVIITGITANNQPINSSSSDLSDGLFFKFHQNLLNFEFCLVNPSNRDAVQYSYRLLGQTNDWTTTNDRQVTFQELSGGEYQLELRAHTGDQKWSTITSLPFRLQSAWWQSLWFKGLMALFLGTIFLGFLLIRARHKRKESALKSAFEKDLAEVQMEALRAQMNPHFLFNTMNSINHYILKNEPDAASSYLTKFARLIRQVLHNSKSRTVKLSDELDALKLYIEIEQLRFEDEFEFELIQGERIDLEKIHVPPMLLQPYVENAIWHGLMHKDGARNLWLRLERDEKVLRISIKDNGIGRKKAAEYKHTLGKKKSFGMQITRDRIGLVNQLYEANTEIEILDLTDNTGEPTGTEVVISIPVM